MKVSLWVLVLAGYFSMFCVLQAANTNLPVLTLELRDGSRVVGKNASGALKFRSDVLGDIKLIDRQLTRIDFLPKTNWVKLTTTNGDSISAEVTTEEIKIESSFGKVTVPINSLRRVLISTLTAGRPQSGLVALWSADEDGNSDHSNMATPMGPIGYGEGKRGRGFEFGDGGYYLVHADDNLDVGKGDGFTFEMWIKPRVVNSEMILFEYEQNLGSSSGSDVGIELAIHRAPSVGRGGGCLYANIKDVGDGSHPYTSPAGLLKPGIWQHVALTYDKATGLSQMYFNGEVVAHENLGFFSPLTNFRNLLIGAKTAFGSPSAPNVVYAGLLDEFGVYNRVLSPEEIRAIYTADGATPPSN